MCIVLMMVCANDCLLCVAECFNAPARLSEKERAAQASNEYTLVIDGAFLTKKHLLREIMT